MKTKILIGLSLWSLTVAALAANEPSLLPVPQKMEVQAGAFGLSPGTSILADPASPETAGLLAESLRKSTGYPFVVKPEPLSGDLPKSSILLTTKDADASVGPEGYELTVAADSVILRAPTQAGLFYGSQTLLQLLPPEIFSSNVMGSVTWQAPCVQIKDWPRFKWRGLMLDVVRHFYSKAEVERYLDNMGRHKLNMFHWHLVDDQGWRIEIKKYPKLTEVSAWRSEIGFSLKKEQATAYGKDGRYGGFYTQDDIREIVAYAAARHITIVPEIEMPGHSMAALAAYPEVGTGDGPFVVPASGGINPGIYSPAKEETFQFLDGVLTEVFQLFPGKYVHIGGDEVPPEPWKNDAACQALMKREGLKTSDELESWFVRRIEKFINANGKTLIGWSEIARGGLAKNAVVMDWIGGGAEAAADGHDVVMSPAEPQDYSYFDHYQSKDTSHEPKAIGGFLPLERVYQFEPVPATLDPKLQFHILGAQGNLWTEYIPNIAHLEYMTYPRACAMAEVTWSPKEARDWKSFDARLQTHLKRLDYVGVKYRPLTPLEK
ncbi:MAG: beta-N-acetylhexosaminidase [Limisphaerales bacterium]